MMSSRVLTQLKILKLNHFNLQNFNYTQLSCLLNQLTDFKIRKRETFKKLKGNASFHARFQYVHKDDDEKYIVIKIGENAIKVTASGMFVKTHFTKQTYSFLSDLRQWGKMRNNPIFKDRVAYLLLFINLGKKSIEFFFMIF